MKHAVHRLLIPIDATEGSRRGVGYAIDLARQAEDVEACLLYIVAPVRNWEVLRFRTEQEIHRHFQERSEVFLEEASAPLRAAGIPCKTYFREQEPVFGILDLAEQLDCTEIVIPKPDWLALISSGIGRNLKSAQRSIPVVLVRPDGSAEH
jgi:nucleotide-binding universal stress UspA family protein